MKFTFNSRIKKILASILLFIVLFIPISQSYNSWLAYSQASNSPFPDGLESAIQIEPDNPDYYLLLGFYYEEYDFQAPREIIATNYARAISLSPFNYNYWFSLADFLFKVGDREKAIFALNHSTNLAPGVVSLRWAGGMLASRMNYLDAVIDNLSHVINNDRGRRDKAFSLLWQSIGNGDQIQKITPSVALTDYYKFLIKTNRIEYAGAALKKMESLDYDISDIAQIYIRELIDNDKLNLAKHEWARVYGDWEGIWNGGFEEEPKNGAFDWRISAAKGAEITRDSNGYKSDHSMKISFDGTENVNFWHVIQYVPVEEGVNYSLSSYIKSEGITTKSGVHWKVKCHKSKELYTESSSIIGTNDWQPLTLNFKTPEYCDLLVLYLRRDKSKNIDKFIAGTIWIDNVQLTKITSSDKSQEPHAYTN